MQQIVPTEIGDTSALIVGFLIFSALHIVIGEQVPQTLAIRMANRIVVQSHPK